MKVRLRVYGPLLVAGLFWGGLEGKAGVVGFCALFAAGVLIWTLLEYLIHRFAFHGFAPHWQHHHDPIDPAFILAPLWLSLSASGVLWVLLSVAAHSAARGALMAAGIVAGYLAYELVHLRIHGRAAGGPVLRGLRKHHYYHHFASDRVCYGVTSPLWDLVFGSSAGKTRSVTLRRELP